MVSTVNKTSGNGIKSTGASGKYRTYTTGDTSKDAPKTKSVGTTGKDGQRIIYPTSGQLAGSTVTVFEGKLSEKQNKGAELLGQLKSSGARVPTLNFSGASLGFQDRVQQYQYAQSIGADTKELGRSQRVDPYAGANYLSATGQMYKVTMVQQQSISQSQKKDFRSDYTGGQGVISSVNDKKITFFGLKTNIDDKTKSSNFYMTKSTDERIKGNLGNAAKYEILAFGVGVYSGATTPVLKTKEFLSGIKETVLNPIKAIDDLGESFNYNPAGTVGEFVGGSLFIKGLKTTVSGTYRGSSALFTKIDPRYIPVSEEIGKNYQVIKGVPTTKGSIDIKIVGAIGSDSLKTQSLRYQASIAGKKVNAVSGARNLFSIIKNEIKVDKPLPNPEASPLEKSFFYDPEARLRPSRLGLVEEKTSSASLSDIFNFNFKIFPDRPQAILTPELYVEKFPINLLDVKKTLLQNKALSKNQQLRFLEFQLTPSGKAKPVGFIGGEPEVTLAPGEVLRKVKGYGGVTLIKNPNSIFPSRVPIIEAEVIQGLNLKNIKLNRITNLKSSLSSNSNIKPYLGSERALIAFSNTNLENKYSYNYSPLSKGSYPAYSPLSKGSYPAYSPLSKGSYPAYSPSKDIYPLYTPPSKNTYPKSIPNYPNPTSITLTAYFKNENPKKIKKFYKINKKRNKKFIVDPLSDALSVFTTSSLGKRAVTPRGKRYTEEFIKSRQQGIEFFKTTYLRSKEGKRALRGLR